ncbi:MAG TPA: hypothetical protein VER06_00215 [Candidatus Methanoperedens sp.]|nr:hypothetical protein [Candidatus Methanoperedens sp.]
MTRGEANVRNNRFGAAAAILAVAVAFGGGCSTKDAKNETVATVNGDDVKFVELREFLGSRGGVVAVTNLPMEKKKEGLDRLVAGRLLAQDARAKGLDNTDAFRTALSGNEKGVWINALLRKEIASKVKIKDSDLKDEAKKMRGADNNLSESDAATKAGQAIAEREIRKIEEELLAAAKKDTPAAVDMESIGKIGKGGKVSDDAALATVGGEKITYGQVRKVLQAAAPGPHGAEGLLTNPIAIQRVIDREATGVALYAYAKKQGLDGSEWMKSVRGEMERAVLINLLAEKVAVKDVSITDKEIEDAYAEHGQMFVRDGKKIPLAQVKDQLRAFLENAKRRKALDEYVESLRKKAKITINESVLPKV